MKSELSQATMMSGRGIPCVRMLAGKLLLAAAVAVTALSASGQDRNVAG